jgi:AP-1 complex subunit beta-1
MAMKCSLDIFYFQTPCMLSVLMAGNGELDRDQYKETWKSIPDTNEYTHTIPTIHASYQNTEALKKRLMDNNIFFIAERRPDNEVVSYYSLRLTSGQVILAETRSPETVTQLTLSCRPQESWLAPLFIQAVNFLVSNNF